ncbi:3-phosphoshikimate 1-carboxyvinyltransferase [Tatumella ptyseos]|uniref:3-phosphoshikimate 1-carboxyvinyltransferase n=1 Tax=Tatumella ptyseos TaxID=82987 RepID=A0A2X5NL92_9GAMM|nr:3-phosphoshikimate 1-carboxyvinyltransferase [Tatumella ptyseos]
MSDSLTLQPVAHVEGTVNLPGSKSVSNRALLLAAMAKGTTRLTNLLDSDDIKHMLNGLSLLGVQYSLSDDRTECVVTGTGDALRSPGAVELFLGNAGTAMRPLAAALSLAGNDIILTGEPRMKERPIGHLVDALRQGGAEITYLENEDYPPLRIGGGFTGARSVWMAASPASF